MVILDLIKKSAESGDLILIGGDSPVQILIQNGQKVQTKTGKPSRWSHIMMYVNEQTVWESTIDFKPYGQSKKRSFFKRMDNGVQYNNIENYADIKRAMLMHFPFTKEQRDDLLIKAQAIYEKGYTYPIAGLVGSLLSYWIFNWKSNPLQSKRSLYCSAAIQEDFTVPSVNIDFDKLHTARNTSPEVISQFKMDGLKKYLFLKRLDKVYVMN